MNDPDTGVRNVSDIARWMAYFRAMESRRTDALFRDPYAETLAGERGFQVAKILSQRNKWASRLRCRGTALPCPSRTPLAFHRGFG